MIMTMSLYITFFLNLNYLIFITKNMNDLKFRICEVNKFNDEAENKMMKLLIDINLKDIQQADQYHDLSLLSKKKDEKIFIIEFDAASQNEMTDDQTIEASIKLLNLIFNSMSSSQLHHSSQEISEALLHS